jgi:hypothetical protein
MYNKIDGLTRFSLIETTKMFDRQRRLVMMPSLGASFLSVSDCVLRSCNLFRSKLRRCAAPRASCRWSYVPAASRYVDRVVAEGSTSQYVAYAVEVVP